MVKEPFWRKLIFSFIFLFLSFSILFEYIRLISRVFANGPGDRGSIPGRVIPKTQKIVLDAPWLALSTIRWGSRVKWGNPGNGVAFEKGTFGSPTLLFIFLTDDLFKCRTIRKWHLGWCRFQIYLFILTTHQLV